MSETNDQDDVEEVEAGKAPKSAQGWLTKLETAGRKLADYQLRADGVDKEYANLERLVNPGRAREFQMLWANISVLGPSIYSRPPIPVVVPRFRDSRPLYRLTSELLERTSVVAFEMGGIDEVMKLCRDDLTIVARAVPWVRYETKRESDTESERICFEHVDRKDFRHEPARKWPEVGWVAKRSFLTKVEMRKRFQQHSGDAYKSATYQARKEDGEADNGGQKAAVWEIWSKTHNRVVWVAEGCDKILDDGRPHLTLEGFFPCPKPAYATVQRRTLIPVPDMAFYKDQLEEVNQLTGRIDALTDAVKLRGFYPSGAGELSDAIESAIQNTLDNKVLIGVSNWAAVGEVKNAVLWLPLDMVITTIKALIELRRQVIDDIYQITGLSDIMRGATVASETLGAQQLKSQYGSIRIRDRQEELVRIARDVVRIAAEIMAENFSKQTMLDMSQLEIESDADIARQVRPLEQKARQIEAMLRQEMQDPETQALAKENPDQAKQLVEQAMQQVAELNKQVQALKERPTIEKVMKLLRDQRLRPFVLDIESDSTIEPDENAQKQRATEYLTSMGSLLGQAVPALQQAPEMGPVLAETIRFAQQQFRVGRQMDQVVDEFVEAVKAKASQPKEDPAAAAAQAKAQGEAKAAQTDMQIKASDAAIRKQESDLKAASEMQILHARQADDAMSQRARAEELDMKAMEATIRRQALEDQRAAAQAEHQQKLELGRLQIEKLRLEIERVGVQTDAAIATTEAGLAAKREAELAEPDAV